MKIGDSVSRKKAKKQRKKLERTLLKEAGIAKEELVTKGGASQVFQQVFGSAVKCEIELRMGKEKGMLQKNKVKIPELQELLLWLLGTGVNPSWIFVKHKALVKTVVLVVLDAMDPAKMAADVEAWAPLKAALPGICCDVQARHMPRMSWQLRFHC